MQKLQKNYWIQTTKIFMTFLCMMAVFFITGIKASAAEIGVVDNGTSIQVNTGAGLDYKVSKPGGSIVSCKMNDIDVERPGADSHIASGRNFDVKWNTFSNGSIVVITCEDDELTHYYISRYGDNNIYMATYSTTKFTYPELRYIFYTNTDVLTNRPEHSDLTDSTGNIESRDVFGFSDGTTASKYYGNDRAKDLPVRGMTGKNVGVFMAYGNRETSSGGPFFRDIQFQTGELYNYMNSGHQQTEAYRFGLHGPYALCFTTGEKPELPDYSFIENLGLKGYVKSSDRGKVVINGFKGMDTNYDYTVAFENNEAQYWTKVNPTGGFTGCYGMKPGTYKMTVYKGEIAVLTESVTVNKGQATILNTRTITEDPSTTKTIWRIGDWDGIPNEFLNGENISIMHPSDVRNNYWKTDAFEVGISKDSEFPAIQFRGVNSPTKINFNLTDEQAAKAHTLKIGITCAYNAGRPSVSINGHNLPNPGTSSQPKSRSITIGTYRGNNTTYTWNVPESYLISGKNTMSITPVSGSNDAGDYLSAAFSYDCLELDE